MLRLFQLVTGLILGGVTVALLLLLRPVGGIEGVSTALAGEPAPGFRLASHDGRTVSLEDFRGRVVVLFFGFTHCPDVCPMTMASLARAMEALGPRSERVQVLLVTVDPERDTTERLGEYLGRFDPRFLGLRGSEGELRQVAAAYGAFFQARPLEPSPHHSQPLPDGSSPEGHPAHAHHGAEASPPGSPDRDAYLVDHSARVWVVDTRGRIAFTLEPFLDGEGIAAALRGLVGGR